MSAYEQKVENPNKNYQYLVIACDPYDNIGFKIPNIPIDKNEGRFVSHFDNETKKFSIKMYFLQNSASASDGVGDNVGTSIAISV